MLKLFSYIRLPLLIIGFVFIVDCLAAYNILPPVSAITSLLARFLNQYGLVAIGIVSFIENVGGINAYFPGSIIILTAMAITGGDPIRGLVTYLAIYCGAFLAYHLDFLVGRILRARTKTSNDSKSDRLANASNLWFRFLTTFWHPHFAAVTCIQVGSEGYLYSNVLKYLVVASFVWNSFWGLVMYHVGLASGASIDLKPLFYTYLVGWLLLECYRFYRVEYSKSKE